MPRLQIGNSKPFVSFYDKHDLPFYKFANYDSKPLTITEAGVTTIYKSPEHYFQAQKIVHADRKIQANLRKEFNTHCSSSPDAARTGIDAFLDAQSKRHGIPLITVPDPNAPNKKTPTPHGDKWFQTDSTLAMLNVVRERYKQDPQFKSLLDGTGNLPIVEDTGGAKYLDNTWGCGPNGDGKNLLGICLMQVRAENRGLSIMNARVEADKLYQSVQADIKKFNRNQGTLLQNTRGITNLDNSTAHQSTTLGLQSQSSSSSSSSSTTSNSSNSLYNGLNSLIGKQIQTDEVGTLDISRSTRDSSVVITGKNRNGEERRIFIKQNGNTHLQFRDKDGWHDTTLQDQGGYWCQAALVAIAKLPVVMRQTSPQNSGAQSQTSSSSASSSSNSLYNALGSFVGKQIQTEEVGTIDISRSTRDGSVVISGKNKKGEERRIFIKQNGNTYLQFRDGKGWHDTTLQGQGGLWCQAALKISEETARNIMSSEQSTPDMRPRMGR